MTGYLGLLEVLDPWEQTGKHRADLPYRPKRHGNPRHCADPDGDTIADEMNAATPLIFGSLGVAPLMPIVTAQRGGIQYHTYVGYDPASDDDDPAALTLVWVPDEEEGNDNATP